MESLLNPSDNQKIINRISSITPESKAQWAKMNAAQMLAHCQPPLLVAFDELKLKLGMMAALFGGYFRKKMTQDEKPFTQNLPTDAHFVVSNPEEPEKEKEKLIVLVQRFVKAGPEGLTKETHPFFGKMTGREWDIIQWKHLDHHLRQFGV